MASSDQFVASTERLITRSRAIRIASRLGSKVSAAFRLLPARNCCYCKRLDIPQPWPPAAGCQSLRKLRGKRKPTLADRAPQELCHLHPFVLPAQAAIQRQRSIGVPQLAAGHHRSKAGQMTVLSRQTAQKRESNV